MSTTYTANTDWGGLYASTQVERTDVRSAEDGVAAATSNAVAAVNFSRVSWLG